MLKDRIEKVKQMLNKEKTDAVLVSSVSNITYLSGYANFSEKEREAYIFIGQDFAYIITDGRYTEAIKRQVPHLTLFERGHKKSVKDLFKKHKDKIKKTLGENYFGILSFTPSAYIPPGFQSRNYFSESLKNTFFMSAGTNTCLEI